MPPLSGSRAAASLPPSKSFDLLPDFFHGLTQRVDVNVGVALPGDPDVAEELVARAVGHARRFSGRWVAFVICNDGLSSLPQAEMAMRNGGTVFFCEADDIAQTLLDLASRERIDILILGAPARRWRLRRGTVERVVSAQRKFDVVVVGRT